MRIRIINEKDWEKSYELDKSIIRVGSQITCDIMINDAEVPALMMQITRSGTIDIRNTMRFFTENVTLTRGDQSFPPDINMPYEVLDGDKITFGRYRMIIELESDKSRVRQSEHMRAEMFLSDRDLAPDSPISGGLLLKNLGTQRPCQFRMNIKGIPAECLYSAPLPYLHPGASSSVGFTISHLKTKPGPGFHTVSITLSAPDDYYGENLEFNQDIYVYPVFDNVMILEDDSDKLTGSAKKDSGGKEDTLPEPVAVQPDMNIRDSGMMNLDESVFASNAVPEPSVRVLGKDSNALNPAFEEEDDDDEVLPGYRRKKERVVVIHGDDDNLFEGETPEEIRPADVPQEDPQPAEEAVPETGAADDAEGAAETISADPEPDRQEPAPEDQPLELKIADTSAADSPEQSGTSKRQDRAEQKPQTVPEEPQENPAPRKKPVKFKPDDFVVYAGKKDAFDEEQKPDAEEIVSESLELNRKEPFAAEEIPEEKPSGASGKDAETPLSEEGDKSAELKKPRKKSSAKEQDVPLSEAQEAKSILVLEPSPAEHAQTDEALPESRELSPERPAQEESIPAEELSPEKQSSDEEQVPKDITLPGEAKTAPEKKPRKKSSAKEPAAEEKPSTEEKAPAGKPSAEDQAPEAEESLISEKKAETASADEVKSAPTKKPRRKGAAKQQENPQPEEEPSPGETVPEETAAEEGSFIEENVPEETLPVNETAAEEGPFAEENVPAGTLPAEETAAEERLFIEENVPEGTLPAEELSAGEEPLMEENLPEETLSAEETAAEEEPFIEEKAPDKEPAPEKKPLVPVFGHSSGFDEFAAAETDRPDHLKARPSETEQEKPAIRVVKGGSFD